MLDDPIEKFFPRREFQKLHYSSDIVEKLTQEKDFWDHFPVSPIFSKQNNITDFFPKWISIIF